MVVIVIIVTMHGCDQNVSQPGSHLVLLLVRKETVAILACPAGTSLQCNLNKNQAFSSNTLNQYFRSNANPNQSFPSKN